MHALGERERRKSGAARGVENDFLGSSAAGVAKPTRHRSEHDCVPVVPLLPAAPLNVVGRHPDAMMARDARRSEHVRMNIVDLDDERVDDADRCNDCNLRSGDDGSVVRVELLAVDSEFVAQRQQGDRFAR